MKEDKIKSWILIGYQTFAEKGPFGLRVESIAKQNGKNKSSFYHFFSDLDSFRSLLLKYHLEQAKLMAQKELLCNSKEEFMRILIEHETDLLFNRQLRIHRTQAEFNNCLLKTNQISENAISKVWSEILGLETEPFLAELIYKLAIENFLLRITQESITKEWLVGYFNELKSLVSAFKIKRNSTKINGSV